MKAPRTTRSSLLGIITILLTLSVFAAACSDDDDNGDATAGDDSSADTADSDADDSDADDSDTAAAGDDSDADADEPFLVGQVMYSTGAYQLAEAQHFEEYAAELGLEVITVNQDLDPIVGADAIEDFIVRGVDGFAYQPVDAAVAVPAINGAQDAGVAVSVWAIKHGDGATAPFLELNESEDTFEAGRRLAEFSLAQWPDRPVSALIVDIASVQMCLDFRMDPFIEGIQSVAPDADITRFDGAGDRLTATNVAEDALTSGADFTIVSGCNAEMALGALAAFESAGRGTATDGVPDTEFFFSIDATPQEVDNLLDPSSALKLVMGLTPKENAQGKLDLLLRVLNGEIDATADEVVSVGSMLIEPDCDFINQYQRDQYFATEDMDC